MVKRVLKVAGLVVVLLVAAMGAVLFSAFSGIAAIVDGSEPVPGVRQVKDGIVSSYVLDAGDGQLVLIDAGVDPTGKALLAEIARRGLKPEAVRGIFVTHGHGDHIAGAHLFPKAEIYGMAVEAHLLDGTVGSRAPVAFLIGKKDTGVRLSHPLADGESVTIGTVTVKAFAIPGHTQGSAAYLARGVVFLGDSAAGAADGTLHGPVWALSDDAVQAKASLKSLAARLDPSEVLFLAPAHTAPLKGLAPLQALAASP